VFRIEPSEIEFKLNSLEGIEDSLVMVQEDDFGDSSLVAYLVVKNNTGDENSIIKWRTELIDYFPFYMVPNEFIILTEFTLTDNGKIDRSKLAKAPTNAENKLRPARISELEKKVIKIWSSSLKVNNIGLDDDFFMMGGHSMIAAQVMQKLEKETGIRLPLTALFEAPTVKKLSHLIDQKGNNSSWKSLVSIKPGGDRRPLYIVHGAGLNVLIFHSLAMNLDPDQPVFGLQARGLNGIDEPFDNMERIAAYYIAEILDQNPNGPYNLAGYSFGGVVAFEMAKQLKAMGKSINMLAIFDTSVDILPKPKSWTLKTFKKLKNAFIYVKFNIHLLIKDPVQTLHYRFINRKYKLMRLLSKFRLIRESSGHEKYLKHSDKINHKHDVAYENYKLTPYNGSVDLFRVTHRMYHLDDPVYFGWKPLALEGLKIHEIPGDHSTFLLSPNVEEFSNLLMATIKERNMDHF
jgi:thioesterase domain-containing protein/acyl carrier protein